MRIDDALGLVLRASGRCSPIRFCRFKVNCLGLKVDMGYSCCVCRYFTLTFCVLSADLDFEVSVREGERDVVFRFVVEGRGSSVVVIVVNVEDKTVVVVFIGLAIFRGIC